LEQDDKICAVIGRQSAVWSSDAQSKKRSSQWPVGRVRNYPPVGGG